MRNFDFKRYTPRPKKLLRASLSNVLPLVCELDELYSWFTELVRRAFTNEKEIFFSREMKKNQS